MTEGANGSVGNREGRARGHRKDWVSGRVAEGLNERRKHIEAAHSPLRILFLGCFLSVSPLPAGGR